MNRRFLLYGTLLGALLIILQSIKYKMMIRDMEIEVFAFILAAGFTAIGIWIGIVFFKRNNPLKDTAEQILNSPLSEREMDVLLLLAQGKSNQEIADLLFVSLNTAKTHISNIYQKLNAKRRTQAVQKAREMGILSLDRS